MKKLLRRFLDAKSGAVAVLQTAIANIAVQAANVISGILTARALGPDGRGALAAIIMWPQFLAFAMTLGIPVATVYWVKRQPDDRGLGGAAIALSLLLGVIAALLGVAIIPYSLHAYPGVIIRSAQWWVLITPLTLCGVTLMALVQSTGSFRNYNFYRVASPLSVVGVLFYFWIRGNLNYSNAAFAYLLAGVPATIWIAFWAWKNCRPRLHRFPASAKLLLGYGVRAWGADLLSTIGNVVDRILVVGMLPAESMGLYVVAQAAANVLSVLPTAVIPVTLPQSSGRSLVEIMELTGKAARTTLVVMVVASLPLVLAGQQLLTLVYGSKFKAAALLLPFLVVESIADGVTSILAQAFLASGFPGTVTLLEGCGVMAAIPLLYVLIPRFGIRGAACALMLATLLRFTFITVSFRWRLGVRPPSMIMRRAEFLTLLQRLHLTSSPP